LPVCEKTYYVQDAYGELYPVWVGNTSTIVDIPEYDLLSSEVWRQFYPEFKEHQNSFKRLASDSVMRLAFDLASESSMDQGAFVIDPSDGKSVFAQLMSSTGKIDLTLDPGAVQRAGKDLPLFSAQYELAVSFRDFVGSRGLGLVDIPYLMQGSYDKIADEILQSAKHSYIPNLVVPVDQQLEEIVRHDIEFDSQWNVGPRFDSILRDTLKLRLGMMVSLVNSSVKKADDGFAGPLVDAVTGMMAFGADKFPGMEQLIEMILTQFARQVVRQGELAGHKKSIYLDSRAMFEFWEGDRQTAVDDGRVLEEHVKVRVDSGLPQMQVVPYSVSGGYPSLANMFPT